MLARERQNTIVEIVNREGSVRVKNLSKKFGVTEDSIRKDLAHLEKNGMLKKTYGGAVRVRTNSHDRYVSQRIGKNVEEKRVIAKRAYEIIQDGDVIFLDISTINIELVKLIVEADRPVTVVTNMIDAILIREKLSKDGNYKYAGIDEFTGLIMEESVEGTIMSKLKSYNIDIYC